MTTRRNDKHAIALDTRPRRCCLAAERALHEPRALLDSTERVATARGLSISMTEQNHCYENCYAERVNGILKDEFNLDRRFRTREQARLALARAL